MTRIATMTSFYHHYMKERCDIFPAITDESSAFEWIKEHGLQNECNEWCLSLNTGPGIMYSPV